MGVFSPGRAEDAIDGGILRVFGFQNKNVLWEKTQHTVTALNFNIMNETVCIQHFELRRSRGQVSL